MTDLTQELAEILEAERSALVAGDFDQIADLMTRKQAIAESLKDEEESATDLIPLQAALRRNQELFDRALEGVRAVVDRLGTVQTLSKSLHGYDAQGKRFSLAEPTENRLEKRA